MTNDRLNVKFYYPEILNYAMVQSQKTEPASLDISSPEELHDVAIVIGGGHDSCGKHRNLQGHQDNA